jgi:hypothetical protein
MDINIIYSDKSIAVVEKPVGVPSQADKTGDADLQSILSDKFRYAGLIHRLDRPVGGLMVFALNKKSETFLSKEMSGDGFSKIYYAVCCGKPKQNNGTLTDWIVKNQRQNISSVSSKDDKKAKKAVLDYRVIKSVEDERFGFLSLLEVKLYTGRHHQIRVQTSNAGFPLWGDTKYNESFKNERNVSPALYSAKIEFLHPETRKKVMFEKIPETFPFSLFI